MGTSFFQKGCSHRIINMEFAIRELQIIHTVAHVETLNKWGQENFEQIMINRSLIRTRDDKN